MSSIKNIIISQATYNDITDKSASGILSYLVTQNLYDPSTQVPIVYLESTKEIICNGTLYGGGIKLNDLNASIVPYSNTDSTLQSTNVQNAINELDAKIYDADNFETVVLTIGSADSSFSPVGQTVTVTLEDGSITTYTIPSSLQISFTIQKGIRYTISMTSTADYRCLPISFIARIPTRYITMRYIPIATGVFILQKDGNYYLREEYDAETMAEDAVGVLVLTSALITAGFGIVLNKEVEEGSFKGGRVVSGIPAGNTSAGKTSLLGYQYTQTIAASSANNVGTWALAKQLIVNETNLAGYIGTIAEWGQIKVNLTEINTCLTLLGFQTLKALSKYGVSLNATGGGNDNVPLADGTTSNYYTGNLIFRPFYYYPIL